MNAPLDSVDLCAGRRFSRPAPTQKEIVRLLRASPLPWTHGMLMDWFSDNITGCKDSLGKALNFRRVTRIERGLYSCPCKTPKPKVYVTDDLLEKYGYKL